MSTTQPSLTTIYCPNCGFPNLELNQECQDCSTPVPKRYLWAVGAMVGQFEVDQMLGDRFIFKGSQLVLDTQPGQSPPRLTHLPESAQPYLKLFPYRLHTPQLFGIASLSEQDPTSEILLLEQVPLTDKDWGQESLSHPASAQPPVGTALPLTQVWGMATELRQLNWLWQMAVLWQPLQLEGVSVSLLQPQLLRVEGAILKLLELSGDTTVLGDNADPSLVHLGQLWQRWLPTTEPELVPKLEDLCDQMIIGEVTSPDVVVLQLEEWLAIAAENQTLNHGPVRYQVNIATRTDAGPSRDHNEDTCYPAHGSNITNSPESLTIVCDGVGGHAGGEVAAALAVNALQEHLGKLLGQTLNSDQLTTELEIAVCTANDLICQLNDGENRQERQRMGTTLVMAQARQHQMYIAHIGDSRAYWITRNGCYQVTLDDDIASREVRLGYALYREALEHPVSGSLMQALGMSASSNLHPTIQRFIIDEDCVFLLCSDGLSDYDRVEEVWRSEILPILEGKADIGTVSQRLVEIANQKNGHDNVTVGIVHCQLVPVNQQRSFTPAQVATQPTVKQGISKIQSIRTRKENKKESPTAPVVATTAEKPSPELPPTQLPNRNGFPLWLLGIPLVGLLGALAFMFVGQSPTPTSSPELPSRSEKPAVQPKPANNSPPLVQNQTNPPSGSSAPVVGAAPPTDTNAGAVPPVAIAPSPTIRFYTLKSSVEVRQQPDQSLPPKGRLLKGSVVQVQSVPNISGGAWLLVSLCSAPEAQQNSQTTADSSSLKTGDTGWLSNTSSPLLQPLGKNQLQPVQIAGCPSAASDDPQPQ
jgi:protein phosphatase